MAQFQLLVYYTGEKHLIEVVGVKLLDLKAHIDYSRCFNRPELRVSLKF